MTEAEVLKALGYTSEKDRVRSYLVSALARMHPLPAHSREEIEANLARSREEIEAVLNKYLERL